MKYLFVFAHPDDETVACASTIKQLVDHGDEVRLVFATAGDAGEVSRGLKLAGSVAELRVQEVAQAAKHLGVEQVEFLEFKDGTITNQDVWGRLQQQIVDVIDTFLPDVVITFDHTGWYYHLDHVGVSIATTLAYHSATHRAQALLFSHYQPGGTRWKYIFRPTPATHTVTITDPAHKLRAIKLHRSQNLSQPKKYLKTAEPKLEFYELAFATGRGKKLLAEHNLFQPVGE